MQATEPPTQAGAMPATRNDWRRLDGHQTTHTTIAVDQAAPAARRSRADDRRSVTRLDRAA